MSDTSHALYQEPFRPQYHFTPPAGWMNDPNGLIFYEGEYHLFFQHFPHGTRWSTMHWGHAISTDLVHWQNLPIALFPDANGPIFSGSVVVDAQNTSGLVPGGGLIAVFSYENQNQGVAYSHDKGRSWTMYEGNPVLHNPGPSRDFRDPKVFWHTPTQRWIMPLAVKDRIKIYTSADLIHWQFASEFGAESGAHGGVWECPDLFPILVEGNTKWVMIVSVGNGAVASGSGTQYFIGTFDGTTFANDNPDSTVLWLDYGKDNYAGVTWGNLPDGQIILIGWMNNWQYANDIPASTWRGAMTIPRRLQLTYMTNPVSQEKELRLVQEPIDAMRTLREQHYRSEAVTIASDQSLRMDITNQAFEVLLSIQPGNTSEVGIKLHQKSGHSTVIGYQPSIATLFVDRDNSGQVNFHPQFAGCYNAPLSLSADLNQLNLRIFVDATSVEVFAGIGEAVLTNLIFPEGAHHQVEVYCQGGSAHITALDVYNLARTWM